jgi:hypothetical protein
MGTSVQSSAVQRQMTSSRRFALAIALLFAIPIATCAQAPIPSNIGNIGPSGAQVAAAIAGLAGVTGLILYFTLRKPAIVGCVHSADGKTTLVDERDKRTYAIAGDDVSLKAGERVKLKGKKVREKDGRLTFSLKKIDHDYGACNP